jgi:hypothetical protein
MTREPFAKAILTACVVAAMLTATVADAGRHPRPIAHDDCSQNYEFMHKSRYFNARMTQLFSYFNTYGTGLIDEAVRDLNDNTSADPAQLYTIASSAEKYLGYHAHETKCYLQAFRFNQINQYVSMCPRIFGRNIAFNHAMCKRIVNRQTELRDQLNAALAAALEGGA